MNWKHGNASEAEQSGFDMMAWSTWAPDQDCSSSAGRRSAVFATRDRNNAHHMDLVPGVRIATLCIETAGDAG